MRLLAAAAKRHAEVLQIATVRSGLEPGRPARFHRRVSRGHLYEMVFVIGFHRHDAVWFLGDARSSVWLLSRLGVWSAEIAL